MILQAGSFRLRSRDLFASFGETRRSAGGAKAVWTRLGGGYGPALHKLRVGRGWPARQAPGQRAAKRGALEAAEQRARDGAEARLADEVTER